ncbi:hypothetical protein SOVF_173890 [Spinacia oleracea]|uniref:F-box protein SKIP23-like n=1 Tax=Spinacia oleracea TaxID=3562 RepID=A0A9R0JPL5_SPIOL|nr:F-box protein SKIP23-like [Spinacia oleracea]XP_021842337.1 F-box protein SKIP23-like [Spinacia oleracea]XP_021842345.1 F-box protein SKIP23-like [Spinacia oleracea]XP_056686396.1 F-box protein SKIP23-like [Spinacia oleracea]XP_056686397.1 F-box protein SKIP23-like [Spinacia oleracea]XP_056686398.1 F-box protein SKIP23-like [Spinacia oleracea]XP_056686399.1 F-box protein SKIP23-like [Spinacia oleracea]XP_056686400.1 F-box protein SKIP23-like [Spinacia oleracea]KNA07215.1 hypothetical pro
MRIRHRAVINHNWPELPEDLFRSVCKRIDSRKVIRRFCSVCKKWRYLFKHMCSKACLNKLLKLVPLEIPSTGFHLFSGCFLVSSIVTLLRPLVPTTTTTVTSAVPPWIVRVEEAKQSNIHLKNPLTGDSVISEQSEKLPLNLDLTQFHVSELYKGFNLVDCGEKMDPESSSTLLNLVKKVLAIPVGGVGEECFILMAVLYNWGTLAVFSIKGCNLTWYPRQYICEGSIFQDVVIFRGKLRAIDEHGKLYQVDPDRVIVDNSVLYHISKKQPKRLVVSESGYLYLVVRNAREQEGISVYMLKFSEKYCENSPDEQGVWEEVNTLDGKVMFLSPDQGFFASAEDFPGRDLANCVVFSTLSFGVIDEVPGQEIGVFRLGAANQALVYLTTNSFAYLWSPPSWLFKPPHTSPFRRDDEKVSFFFPELEFLTSADENKYLGLEDLKSGMERNLARLDHIISATETAKSEEKVHGASSNPALTSLTQISDISTPMTMFKGLNVRSDLAPILREIWVKHGNILDGCTMRNGDIVARALESLAAIVLSLENSTGSSFTKEEVNYLRSTLADLQHMKLNVEWLVPSVEKATDSYKARELVSTLEVIGKVKVRASETKEVLLAELAKVEKLAQEAENVELHLSSWLACLPNQLEY